MPWLVITLLEHLIIGIPLTGILKKTLGCLDAYYRKMHLAQKFLIIRKLLPQSCLALFINNSSFAVFFGLISLYLAAQLELCLVASLLMGLVVVTFLLSLSSWFTVYACYNQFSNDSTYGSSSCYATTLDSQATQPLLSGSGSGPAPPPLPPGHPSGQSGSGGYHLGQYPQYYPPHSGSSSSRALPSAPPTSSNGIYPHLPSA